MKKSSHPNFKLILYSILCTILICSCSDDRKDSPDQNLVNKSACKDTPLQLMLGRQSYDIKYNEKDKPVKITTTTYYPPSQNPIIVDYILEYNSEGKTVKVSKFIKDKIEKYYIMDYNSKGELTKQSQYNDQNISTIYTLAAYDNNGQLTKITTHDFSSGTDIQTATLYEYSNGNLVKKLIENLYLAETEQFHDLSFTYTYYADKETKLKPFFEGLLGLCFISNFNDIAYLQYLPKKNFTQILYAQETLQNKNMLKNIEVTSNHSESQGNTVIDYSYTYDSDGFPAAQKGNLTSETSRSEPTPFGVPIVIKTPVNESFEKSINYFCE